MAIICVDFDGTCIPAMSGGYTNKDTGAAGVLRKLISAGHKIVLWTARNDSADNPYNYTAGKLRAETSLQEAVRWFKERGIPLSGINESPGEKELIGTSRKILGDYLIDDTSLGMPLTYDYVECIDYQTGQISLQYTYFVDWGFVETILRHKKLI